MLSEERNQLAVGREERELAVGSGQLAGKKESGQLAVGGGVLAG